MLYPASTIGSISPVVTAIPSLLSIEKKFVKANAKDLFELMNMKPKLSLTENSHDGSMTNATYAFNRSDRIGSDQLP
jgi:uncharacterized pyridoxamine 5'-phosphate oxidase family protein